jgi:uncharacterized protein YvpB
MLPVARPQRESAARRGAVIRRRRLLVFVVVAAASTVAGAVAGARTEAPGTLLLMADDRPLAQIDLAEHATEDRLSRRSLRAAVKRALPRTAEVTRGRARFTYRYDLEATLRGALARGVPGGRLQATRRPLAASVRVPFLRQAQANTCESAALSILLAATGRTVDQRALQAALPRSGPLDPQGAGGTRTWGDPDQGYVGRPDGGGTAGGFGVYPGPVRATARRYGVRLTDLSGRRAASVYRKVLEGRPVMVWVGLSDGPYGTWRAPDGRPLKVNFGEHTVVVYGTRTDGRLRVSNPLQGTDELWSRQQFEVMWNRLGRRALSL